MGVFYLKVFRAQHFGFGHIGVVRDIKQDTEARLHRIPTLDGASGTVKVWTGRS